eukprot:SAG22_NODE_491_length_9827_cov_6.501028_2_plen_222_part_00
MKLGETAAATAVARRKFNSAGRSEFEHKWIARAAFQASTIGSCGELNLLSCNVDDESVARLARVLHSSKLQTINLTFNEVGDRGAGLLALGIRKNRTVTELSLANNKIGCRGARALAEAFSDDGELEVLNLAGNWVRDPGAKALAKFLVGQNQHMVELCLDSNMIGTDGWEALQKELVRNRTGPLGFISLAGNTGCSGVLIKAEDDGLTNMPGMSHVNWHT